MKTKLDPNCIFCQIIEGKIPCYKIYEDETTLAFLDISKDVEGHTLVIPKKHQASMQDATNCTLHNVFKTVNKICKHYYAKGYTGMRIQINSGETVGQSVHHLHVHILPTKATQPLKEPATKPLNINLEELANLLRLP